MDNTVKSSTDFQIREKARRLESPRYKAPDSTHLNLCRHWCKL